MLCFYLFNKTSAQAFTLAGLGWQNTQNVVWPQFPKNVVHNNTDLLYVQYR
jgi:hypothetical protein